jgi:hypothetical protein
VHATTVARALAGVERPGPVGAEQTTLPEPEAAGPQDSEPAVSGLEAAEPDDAAATKPDLEPAVTEPAVTEPAGTPVAPFTGSARVAAGAHRCRYAGAMLLFPYLGMVGAEGIFATLAGGPARRYDDLAVLTTATLGFALGVDTVEGTKHLRRAEAGAAAGLVTIPELATLRARLSALADGSDPLGPQRAFAAGMLAADPAADPVYFVDDHFVPYSGARPVAKGWNTKRRHAQPGRNDTLLVDARGRAVVFGSGEPSGLVCTLPGVLAGLREVLGPDVPILLGFDRGGAYPRAFTACRDAGAHWVTYPARPTGGGHRRAPAVRDGARRDTGQRHAGRRDGADQRLRRRPPAHPVRARRGGAAGTELTSDTTATGAALLCWLRARWRIENMFKYAAEHNGIDTLADYGMDIGPDTGKVTNPARVAARKAAAQAEAHLITAQRALPQLLAGPGTPTQMNAALPGVHQQIAVAADALERAKTALRAVPAKVPATEADPNATRARPRLARRGLQMVLRLLAFNAEAWLAEHLNAYLADPNEYRAILRNLLHLGGQVDYTTGQITVTLDRPDSPRVAHALDLLADELNASPAHLPGDRRPLTYQVTRA